MWWTLAVKAVYGGLFVVLFSLIAELLTPKRFAGLFSAAPSVAPGQPHRGDHLEGSG
jgi:hypothetical protein